MSHPLVSHNEDILRLIDKGYALSFDDNHYLVVRDIPYLDHQQNLQMGAIVSKFVDLGQNRIAQDDHQVYFAGGVPHGLNGAPIPNLGGGPASLALSEVSSDVAVQRSFSNKPKSAGKFTDFYEKIESYVAIICGPAIELFQADPLTFRVAESSNSNSPFKVRDTLTSRAELGHLSAKFKADVIAIIGLGGTGSYLLDFLVKTPVREIRAFDQDLLYVHNTFRSPGKLEVPEIGKSKAEVYQARYEHFRHGLSVTQKFIDGDSASDLEGVTFAFVCVDSGPSRAEIFNLLISLKIPFIDVGMGLSDKKGALDGMLRATYYSAERGNEVRDKGLAELSTGADDMYRRNIQIAELNALNACLAVIKFKQLRGFYCQESPFYHLLFELGELKILGDEETV